MVLHARTITHSAEETQKLGAEFGHTLLEKVSQSEIPLRGRSREQLPRLVCLWGELGSGKTTFTQGLAKGIGITNRLLSPTFIIVRRYDIPRTSKILYHMDLYRMTGSLDVAGLGVSEMLTDPNALVVIEWPERLGALLPANRIDARFSTTEEEDAHEIQIHIL